MKTKLISLFALAFCLLAEPRTGQVVKILDGDTIKVHSNGQEETIRLDKIDAPEKKQPYGKESQKALEKLLTTRTVTIEGEKKDRYGRTIAEVFVYDGRKVKDGLDKEYAFVTHNSVNQLMVARGHAWAYEAYSKKYKPEETNARALKIGLWKSPNPTPPWEYRKAKRNQSAGR